MTTEELRRRIEVAMNKRYSSYPDSDNTRWLIDSDLALLHDIFPELDITAEVGDDLPDAHDHPGVLARLLDLSSRVADAYHRASWFDVD